MLKGEKWDPIIYGTFHHTVHLKDDGVSESGMHFLTMLIKDFEQSKMLNGKCCTGLFPLTKVLDLF